MDTTAIIQFIGIVLFSASVPNDPGVHAILPRIGEIQHIHNTSAQSPKPQATLSPIGVETHVSVIMYRGEDRQSGSGTWKQKGNLKNGWEYVMLDGEQVQFLTNGTNNVPEVPTELPDASPLTESCPRTASAPTLKAPFQPPLYKGAAAVVDIPFGTLGACVTNTPSVTERVDTTLVMKTEGALIITAKKTTEVVAKTITLDGDAVVYVANVPPYYLLTGTLAPNPGEPHFHAYASMIDTECPSRPEYPSVAAACELLSVNPAYKIARSKPPSDQFKLINSECSIAKLR